MSKSRLEAFTDGVLAVIITILVLELKVPQGVTLSALGPLLPMLLSYVLSFVYIAIYWNNHHHLLHATEHINGKVLWANMHLLFWLSMTPFATAWMGQSSFAAWPVATYGTLQLLAGTAYSILTRTLIQHHGQDSLLATAIGTDRKGNVSIVLYASALPLAFVNPMISCGLYVAVAIMWLLPDPRIEKNL